MTSKNYPKISIVTAVYNQAQFIEKTILSVLEQNYPNLEYIIIDGGSTDGTVDIIKKYEKYLTYWISEPDKGHANALNKGFARTTGEIMAWINGDDMYFPWTFRVVAEIFTQFPGVKWLSGFPTTRFENDEVAILGNKYLSLVDFLLGDYKWIQQESVFWRRSLWEEAGSFINENFKYMVDGELWSRFFRHAELFYTNVILASYRMHSQNRAFLHRDEVRNEMEFIIEKLRKEYHKQYKILLRLSKLKYFITNYYRFPGKNYILKQTIPKIAKKKIKLPLQYKIITLKKDGYSLTSKNINLIDFK